MSIKLLVRQGGGAASQPDIAGLAGREGLAVFDHNSPLIEMGQRWEQGTSSLGFFQHMNPDADADYLFRPHAEVKLIEDASGSDVVIAWNRIEGGNDTGRISPYTPGLEVRQSIQTMDCNLDLRGLPFATEWVRPAEDSWARLQALVAAKLSGSSSTSPLHRSTTNITCDRFTNGHLVDATSPVDMEAKTYPVGTEVEDIMRDILEEWGKGWGVTIHHTGGSHKCLLVQDYDDLAKFTSALKISDQVADWDPTHATAPVMEPKWARGDGKLIDQSAVISGLISIYGGLDGEPRSLTVETGEAPEDWETWWGVYNDDLAQTLVPATRRANHILEDRKRPYVTNRPSILMEPTQVHLITAGQAIQVKSVVINQNSAGPHDYVWRRIAEIRWEPNPDGRWWAHLELDRPRNSRPAAGGGQPGSTTPKPPPECEEQEPDTETILSDSRDGDAGATVTTGACWGGDPHKLTGGSGFSVPNSAGIAVTPGDVIRGTVNFRDETGDDSWENVDAYNYDADLIFTKAGGGLPALRYQIINERFHNAGCINVTRSTTQTVPTGYDHAHITFNSRLGGYQANGWLSEVTFADPVENDPFCLPSPTGESPFFARSDDPRFDNDDQHLITTLQERVINNSGVELNIGDIVIPDITQDDPSVTTTTDLATSDAMVGMVREAGGVGETIVVMWQGSTLQTLNAGAETPVPGDYVYTSTTAGAAHFDATRDEGAVARVIATDADDNTTLVLWWGVPDSGSGTPVVTDHGALTGLADNDHPQYRLTTDGGQDVINVVAAAGSTETLDLADGNVHDVTLTADCTITLSGATAGVECSMAVLLRQGSGAPWEVTWPGSVEWTGGVAPTLETVENAWNWVNLTTLDGGTLWFGDGGGGGTAVGELDDLTDVTITSPAAQDQLNYTGTEWVNNTGHWEVIVDGTAPPVAVTTEAEDDWIYGWVAS